MLKFTVKTYPGKTTFSSFICWAHHVDELSLFQEKEKKRCPPATTASLLTKRSPGELPVYILLQQKRLLSLFHTSLEGSQLLRCRVLCNPICFCYHILYGLCTYIVTERKGGRSKPDSAVWVRGRARSPALLVPPARFWRRALASEPLVEKRLLKSKL